MNSLQHNFFEETTASTIIYPAKNVVHDLPRGHALLKVDLSNTFNSLHQDKMFEAVQELAPDIYPLVGMHCIHNIDSCTHDKSK